MTYTEIHVTPVMIDRLDDFRANAELVHRVWREHGALSYMEVEADDTPHGTRTSFPRSVDLKAGERVFVAIITYHSRAHRDAVSAAAMADPRLSGLDFSTMPFDAKRMFWGGFKPFLGAAAPTGVAQPYLFFRGRCEEAIDHYKRVLGAEVRTLMRFKDNPDHPPSDGAPHALDHKIMHADMTIAGNTVMMSDGMKSGPLDFACMSVALTVSDPAECDRVFAALAKDGKVDMPPGPTFFARRFAGVTDAFGVSWMIMVPPAAA